MFTGNAGLLVGPREFVLPVLIGNTIGGVVLVTLLDFGQTEDRFPGGGDDRHRYRWRQVLLGVRAERADG